MYHFDTIFEVVIGEFQVLNLVKKILTDVANDQVLIFATSVLAILLASTVTIVYVTVAKIPADLTNAWFAAKACLWLLVASGIWVIVADFGGVIRLLRSMLKKVSDDIHQGGALAIVWISSYITVLCTLLTIYKLKVSQNADALLAIMAVSAGLIVCSLAYILVKSVVDSDKSY